MSSQADSVKYIIATPGVLVHFQSEAARGLYQSAACVELETPAIADAFCCLQTWSAGVYDPLHKYWSVLDYFVCDVFPQKRLLYDIISYIEQI